MIAAFTRAARQLPEPALRGAVIKGVGAALAFFVALAFAMSWLVGELSVYVTVSDGWIAGLVEGILALAGGATVLLLTFFLFPVVAISATTLFLDPVIDAVEARYYPDLPAPRNVPVLENLSQAFAFLGVSLLINLVVLPLYLIPGLNVVLFYLVNGYLAGREYLEMVATRRKRLSTLKALRKKRLGRIWSGGAVITVLLTVPILNLLAPVLGAAAFVHLLAEDMRGSDAGDAEGPN